MIEFISVVFQPDQGGFYLPLLNYGVLGIAVIALGIVYSRKDARCNEIQEKRIKESADQAEKYRLAMAELNKTLDSTLRFMQSKNPGGIP